MLKRAHPGACVVCYLFIRPQGLLGVFTHAVCYCLSIIAARVNWFDNLRYQVLKSRSHIYKSTIHHPEMVAIAIIDHITGLGQEQARCRLQSADWKKSKLMIGDVKSLCIAFIVIRKFGLFTIRNTPDTRPATPAAVRWIHVTADTSDFTDRSDVCVNDYMIINNESSRFRFIASDSDQWRFRTGPSNVVNTLRPKWNGRHFADDTFKHIFLNENVRISIKISLKFVPKGPFNNKSALVQIMAWRRPGDKPLSEPMMVRSLTHICVTRPQWVKSLTGLCHYEMAVCCITQTQDVLVLFSLQMMT